MPLDKPLMVRATSSICRGDAALPGLTKWVDDHRDWLGIVLISAAVIVAYWPARHGGFVLDDDLLLTHNSIIQSPNGLNRFWFTKEAPDYWPVTNSTLWIEWRLWGLNPTGYHITNLVLHIVDSLLVWLVLRRLRIPGAFLAALLFAVHPVNVESVAWIAQRKNVLALLFFLLSILWWLKAEQGTRSNENEVTEKRRGARAESPSAGQEVFGIWYYLSLVAFILAMLSKGSVAILPVVLLLLAWWQRGHVTWSDGLRCAPFFAVAAVLTLVDIWFQTQGSGEIIRDATFWQRLLGAGAVVWFYLAKAVAPINLSFVYPQWDINGGNFLWWLPLLAVLAVTVVLVWQRNSSRQKWVLPLLFAWVFFCVALLPVMGFTDVGFMKHSLVADHYQHIAMIAVVALAGAAISSILDRSSSPIRWTAAISAGVVVVALTILAREQSSLYASPLALYEDTVQKNPASWLAHNNLGNALVDANRKPEALLEFQRTVQLKPDSSVAHNNLGIRLSDAGQWSQAIDQFQQALRLQTNYADAYNNLAMALVSSGRSQEALEQLKQAIKYQPDFAEAHNNLGTIYLNSGRLEDAVEQFQQALNIKTDYFEARNNLALVLAKSGVISQAIEQYQQALRLKPDSAETHSNLGNALAKVGRMDEAIEQYQQALHLRPDYVQAYVNLAMTKAAVGQTGDAISAAQTALELARLQNQTLLASQIDSWLLAHRPGAVEK